MPLINAMFRLCIVCVAFDVYVHISREYYEFDLFALIRIYLTHVVCCIALQRMYVSSPPPDAG
jgi:hypothetical protein